MQNQDASGNNVLTQQANSENITFDEILKLPAGEVLDSIIYKELHMRAHAPYSTDIRYAWILVEKFSPIHLFILERDPQDLEWNCSFNAKHGIGFADTASLAICRAALLIG